MAKKITLACSECGSRNYSSTANQENQTERRVLKKFCKNCNAHTVHRETK
ncbi:50S ribosomal protein L33 [Mesobacillus maritimus]|uniref:Large ribosomal subunit protein bL33 n=1 Tax=Mesobacillus maritimus TaxID=1643336 RepID=A0ABS7JZH5_9BACI|nr:50S ribosomal protein L33 [Mesobacillus maritimus]MBY0095392.1 50S ribosomal protein L33 [Mesobacillus maritimus]